MRADHSRPGAIVEPGVTTFSVWAPRVGRVELHVVHPFDKVVSLEPDGLGYHSAPIDGVEAGARYFYRLDGRDERPDPASLFQLDGVHGPSEVVDTTFEWTDGDWRGISLRDYVIYEMHIGTATPEGTFEAAIGSLDELKSIGFTAIEVMPIAQFPGDRNWGYDGVYPYAAQASYGGPWGFARFVDACHARGLAVVLDVVYNHFGPEGCYLDSFGPYFTDRYRTPWGRAVNFDNRGSDDVRRFFIGSAIYWLETLHVDAFRVDAIDAIVDTSPTTFLEELTAAVDEIGPRTGRPRHLMAESAANDPRVVTASAHGGYGFDAVWNDDFHHSLNTLLTGASDGYYADYGSPDQLARAFEDGFVYQGDHSTFLGRRHGRSSRGLPPERFVVFSSNHDQIGNRPAGDRFTTRLSFEDLKLAAAAVLLSPFIPLVFQGEEYGESAPFAYFVSHSDPNLVEAVRKGRREEFAAFDWADEVPDPQDEATFRASKLDRSLAETEPQQTLREWYRTLISLRRDAPAITLPDERHAYVPPHTRVVVVTSTSAADEFTMLLNFGAAPTDVELPGDGSWERAVDSALDAWQGPGSATPERTLGGTPIAVQPRSVVAYRRS